MMAMHELSIDALFEQRGWRIELGSGDRPTDGFVNTDERELPGIHMRVEAGSCEGLPRDSFAEVRATHLLEHFPWHLQHAIMATWVSLLRIGGTLYVEVPDLGWQVTKLIDTMGDVLMEREVVRLMYGDQDYEGNTHRNAFTIHGLRSLFIEAGLTVVNVHSVGAVICATGRRDR